jgi:tRNA-Thr(GGU) m(6)t(6)A37 methyltransferase TsaA
VQELTLRPIGVVRSPHVDPAETPIQPQYATGVRGTIELLPEYEAGLEDIERFSHICVIFQFHRSRMGGLTVRSRLDGAPRGVFATRSPRRPNPLGLSVVRLVGREGAVLTIEDVDMLDGSPVLDIKPYIERFETDAEVRSGWQGSIDESEADAAGARGSGRDASDD